VSARVDAGVRRVLGPGEQVAGLLVEDGWDVALVPRASGDDALWDGLASALALPGWFGRNLDALDEVLHDLERPTALVLAAWWAYATARPERWAALLELLTERSLEEPPLLVVLAD